LTQRPDHEDKASFVAEPSPEKPIREERLERFEAGRHAFIAVHGDVQIGWCIKRDKKWHIQDMDCQDLAGPFPNLRTAARAGVKVLAEFAGESNPGQ
jgi:hypothetical protein